MSAAVDFGLGLRPEHYEEIAATPGRVSWFEALSENYMVPGGSPLRWLDRLRRDYWREKGEPDRMPPPLLGAHDEKGAAGHSSSHNYVEARDGDYQKWRARRQALEYTYLKQRLMD